MLQLLLKSILKMLAAASKQVTTLTASYEKAATAMNSMSAAHDDVRGYTEQMKSAGKNMAASQCCV
jgi:hypothetical protein